MPLRGASWRVWSTIWDVGASVDGSGAGADSQSNTKRRWFGATMQRLTRAKPCGRWSTARCRCRRRRRRGSARWLSLVGPPPPPSLAVGGHPAGGSDERGWRPRWLATLTLVAHTCSVSRRPHWAALLLGCCCCCCCCCARAYTSTGDTAAAAAGRATQLAAPASVGGVRFRRTTRTPAAPAFCALASVSSRSALLPLLSHFCCCCCVRACAALV